MSRSSRCVTTSLFALNALTQDSKEMPITRHSIMPHEPDYMDVLRRLLAFKDDFMLDLAHVTESFPLLLEQLLPGKVRLILNGMHQAEATQTLTSWYAFPIRYQERTYGTLFVASAAVRPKTPVLPPSLISVLTSLCGAMLALFEHQLLLQGTTSPPLGEMLSHNPLTRRQQEVLSLISLGYDEREIAARLHIARSTVESHRQSIYMRLGVHTKHDAIRVAYQAHLFSPLQLTREEPENQKTHRPAPGKKRRRPPAP